MDQTVAVLSFGFVPPRPFTLVVGGDPMLNGIRPGSGPLSALGKSLSRADFAFVNLEVPLTSAKIPTKNKSEAERKAKSQFVLKADPLHIAALKNAGIDAVSLANNHTMDYGAPGLSEERSLLSKHRILAAGAGATAKDAAALTIVPGPRGFRVGLLSALAFAGRAALRKCTPARVDAPGVNVLAFDGKIDAKALAKLRHWIAPARARCDYLVVALHWGIERQPKPTAYQIALGRAVVEAGADLVWGAHPHVLQPIEVDRRVPILYSTGNLVSALSGRSALFHLEISAHLTVRIRSIPVNISGGKASIPSDEARTVAPERILFSGGSSDEPITKHHAPTDREHLRRRADANRPSGRPAPFRRQEDSRTDAWRGPRRR